MERGRPMLSQQQLLKLMLNPGGMETMAMAGLLMATATMERGLQMLSQLPKLMPNPGGMETMAMAGLLMAMATMERDLLMLSPLQMLMPNPGGMETMDTTDTLLMAMATMERDLLMPSLLQMPSLGGTEAMDMAGPMVSIGANLTIN